MKRLVVGSLVAVIVATTVAVVLPGRAGADTPPQPTSHFRVKAKHHCYQFDNASGLRRKRGCETTLASNGAVFAAPTTPAAMSGVTPFPPEIMDAVGPPWDNGQGGNPLPAVQPHVDFGYGWLIYVHFTHHDVSAPAWYATIGAFAAAGLLACSPLGALAAVCSFLFALAGVFMGYLFQTAWNRGGGLVLEFTYWGQPWGFEYVGNNYTS
jgi:hypothetical protein